MSGVRPRKVKKTDGPIPAQDVGTSSEPKKGKSFNKDPSAKLKSGSSSSLKAKKKTGVDGELKKKTKKRKQIDIFDVPKLLLLVVLVTALSFTIFHNSLNNPFLYDDHPAVEVNPFLQGTTPISDIFVIDFWGRHILDAQSHKSYRPLTTLSFRFNYFFSQLDVYGYHLTNILLHSAVSFLVGIVALIFFRKWKIAFLAALLFTAHPIHCDVVDPIVGRADILAGLFFLLGLLSYMQFMGNFAKFNEKKKKRVNYERNLFWFVAAIFFCICSILSKETGAISQVLFGFFEVCTLYQFERETNMQARSISSVSAAIMFPFKHVMSVLKSKSFVDFGLWQAINILCFAGIMSARALITQSSSQWILHHYNYIADSDSFLTRALSFPYFHFYHYWLLIWPYKLACDYSYISVALVESFSDINNLYTISGYLLVFIVLPVFSLRQSSKNAAPLLFCLGLLILPFIPCSNIFFYTGFEVAERIMYLPSMGFCLLVAFVVDHLMVNVKWLRGVVPSLVFGLLIAYSYRSYTRNAEWSSSEQLWGSLVTHYPNNAKAHFNLAARYYNEGKGTNKELITKAFHHAKISTSIRHDAIIQTQYAQMLMDHRRIPEAEVALQKAIDQPLKNTNTENRSHGHKLTETYDMMTNIKLLQKKFDEAMLYLELKCETSMKDFTVNQGLLKSWLSPKEDYLKSLVTPNSKTFDLDYEGMDYQTALKITDNIDIVKTMQLTDGQKLIFSRNPQAKAFYTQQLKLYPGHPGLLFEMALEYFFLHKPDVASFLCHSIIVNSKCKNLNDSPFAFLLSLLGKEDKMTYTIVHSQLQNLINYQNKLDAIQKFKEAIKTKDLSEDQIYDLLYSKRKSAI